MQAPVSPLKRAIQTVTADVTPTRLWFLLGNICMLSLLFFITSAITVEQHTHAVRTVGFDAAPSVKAAHWIKIGAEKMDTDLADELLSQPGTAQAKDMVDDFEQARLNVCKQLVVAAKNITYASEQSPMERVQAELGQYEMQAQAVRDLHNTGKSADALNQYRAALQTLQDKLLTSADDLNKANANELDDTYAREKGASAMSRGLVTVIGVILIMVLVYTQFYLAGRFHRRLNMPLLVATLCAGLFLQHLSAALGTSSRDLKEAKEDSYDSVVALLDARADSYEANAAERRWLLDRDHALDHQKRFRDKVATIADFTGGHAFSETIDTAERQLSNSEKFNLPGFNGSLANELNNSTFAGEGRAALDALQAFSDYCATDSKLRELEKSGAHHAAVGLALSYSTKGASYQFNKYDDALQRALDINEDHLQSAVNDAVQQLSGLISSSILVTLLVVVCAYVGLRPRLEEYQKVSYMHKKG